MRVRWTRPALSDFFEAQEYIAKDNPEAASEVAGRVWQASQHLADNPHCGRHGHIADTREWVINGTPFMIVYRVRGSDVEILRLWHGRRNWQGVRT